VKDVNHDFEIIEYDPLARRKTVDRGRAQTVIFLQSRFNFVRDRFELRFRSRRTDDEKIGETRNAGQVENDDVFGLFI